MRDSGVIRWARGALIGLAVALLLLAGAGPASAAAPNPTWPSRCPQRIVVVLDLSTSIGPNLPAVKKSASDLVDALRGAPNQVGVVTFGSEATVAIPMLNAGDDVQRQRLKDEVGDVGLLPGDGGGTNWEVALTTAASLKPDVVLFLTDGEPTAHGDPFSAAGVVQDSDDLAAAVRVADSMRRGGTRIVGVGMGLLPQSVPNLVEVTGPVDGDDYYETSANTDGLLNRLYDIASKTCGIPVAALPQPEAGSFPVLPVVGGILAAALLAVIGGYIKSRRKPSEKSPTVMPKGEPIRNPSISLDEIPAAAIDVTAAPPATPVPEVVPSPEGRPRRALGAPRRLSVRRLHTATGEGSTDSTSTSDDRSSGPADDRR